MRLLCLLIVGMALTAGTADAVAVPVEAPDIEAKANAGAYKIYCADLSVFHAWGLTSIDYNMLFIDSTICERLRKPFAVDPDQALAILAVTHELTHLWWRSKNEATTECFALFVFRWEARHNYGATVAQANALYDIAWQIHRRLSPAYTTGCARRARDPLPG